MAAWDAVLEFWLYRVGPDGWFAANAPDVDQEIRDRFMGLWDTALHGGLTDWCASPEGALCYLIVTDQFSRNMWRGDARSFATDALARRAARQAIARNDDLKVSGAARVFFYLPFEHHECLSDQEWNLDLIAERLPDPDGGYRLHGRVHHEIIRRFGRFPYRNEALGRISTAEEEAFLQSGGYGAVLHALAP